MKDKLSLKKEIVKIVFCIFAVMVSTVVVTNMITNSFNDRLKNDNLDKMKQYAQLVGFSTEKLMKDYNTLVLNDESKLKLKQYLKVLESGEIPGIDDVIDNAEYRIYEFVGKDFKVSLSSSTESYKFEEDISELINTIAEDGEIKAKETSDNKFHAFAPIKAVNGTIIGVVEIISNTETFTNNINDKARLFIICISIIMLLWAILKIAYIISKQKDKQNKYQKSLFIIFILSILAIMMIFTISDFRLDSLTKNKLEFKEIADSLSDKNGNVYLTDTANTRILKINKDEEVQYELIGNKTGKGKFFYVVNIDVDSEENLYVLNNILDESGTRIAKEEILKYDSNGKFIRTIYCKEYEKDDMPFKKGKINSIQSKGNSLYIVENESNRAEISSYNFLTDEIKKEFSVEIPFDFNLIIDMVVKESENEIILSTKNGEVLKVDKDNKKKILISSADNSKFVPSEIETDTNGNVYCIDHGSTSISKLENDKIKKILDPEILKIKGANINTDPRLEHGYYRFSIDNNKITTSEHSYVIVINNENQIVEKYFNSVKFPPKIMALKITILFLCCVALMTISYLIIIKSENTKKLKSRNSILKESICLVIVILSITSCISAYFINNYESAFQSELEIKLKRISYLKSKTIDGDILNNIKNVNQYMGQDYLKILEESKEGFNSFEDEWNVNYYSAIYKKVDGKINAIVYSDGTNLLLYPMSFTTNDSKNIFSRVLDYGSIEYTVGSDFQGEWLSGFSPIRDSKGDIVAVLEIGADGNYYRMQTKSIIKDTIINIISIIIVLVFFFIEINIFMGLIFKKNKNEFLKYDVKIVRFVSFLIYSILNIPLFFIPIVMKNLLEVNNFFSMSKEIAIGLPLTAEMISLVIASGIGGTISDKSGWKKVFVSGIIFMMIGSFCGGIAKTPIIFIIANALIGFGLGLSSVSTQSFIFYSRGLVKDKFDTNEVLAEFNSGSYAGANCGILFGTMIAEKIGFSNAFFSAIIVGIITLLVVLNTMPNFKNSALESNSDNLNRGALIKLICDSQIINFATLVLLPIIIVSFFVVHFFPIYGDEQGISGTVAGLGYMVQGITVIYLGPILTRVAIKYLKPTKTVILSSLIAFGGILLFAFKPSILMAFVAIFILGISEAVGQSARVNYFLDLQTTKLLGEGKSLALFTVFENLGTVIGPTIFALILSNNNISSGMSMYGGISLIFTVIFAITAFKLNKKNKRDVEAEL